MYKKISRDEYVSLKNRLPKETDLWLTNELKRTLYSNICQEDLENVKRILYKDFLRRNPQLE